MLRTSTTHEDGCHREWAINTKAFIGDEEGNLKALRIVKLDWQKDPETGRMLMQEVPGTEEEIPCELALLAAGFLHPQHLGLVSDLELDRKSTRLNSSHVKISYAVFCLKKKKTQCAHHERCRHRSAG